MTNSRGVPPRDAAIWDSIENDDVLAAGLARTTNDGIDAANAARQSKRAVSASPSR